MLKVLLVEDDPAKKGRLLDFLNARKGELFDTVSTTLSVSDAIQAMKDVQYDLLLVDVVLPAVLGGQAHERNSITLLEQIDEGVGIRKPRFSVAISAVQQLGREAQEYFVGRPWGILPYANESDEWLSTIEKIAQFILQGDAARQARPCDVFLHTALMDPEFSALEAIDLEWAALEPMDSLQFVRYGQIEVGGQKRIVAAAFAPRMGAVATAILVSKAISLLRPKLTLMVGMCAGIVGKANIGDVIAADLSWDWQSGKYVDKDEVEHFEISPDQIAVDEDIRSQLILLRRDAEFWASLGVLSAQYKQKAPRLVVGPMATGSSVLADDRVAERIRATQHRGLVGLDMEVYGAYASARAHSPRTRFLALKSVCDMGNRKKDDRYQSYAAQISVMVAAHFLKKFSAPLFASS